MMRTVILGFGALLLASTALAQVAETVTAPVPAVGQVAAPTLSPAAVEAERKASEARAREQETLAEQEREASEKRMKEQEKQAEKERKAAEKQAEVDRKAAEKAAAEAAAAEKLAADKAAADQAAAARAAAAAPAPVAAVPLAKDSRDRVVQVCLAEAQRRGAAVGAADVSLEEVKDTDIKSDGRASVEAKMNLVTKDSKGRIKTSKKKVTCETKNNVVTKFKVG